MTNVELGLRHLSPVYAGERVAGTARVTLDEPADLELSVFPHLTVTREPNVVGLGYRDGVVVHRGRLDAGSHELPFELTTPGGPASFAGECVRFDWKVEAVAKTASGSVRAETPLSLRPARAWTMSLSPFRGAARPGDMEGGSLGCGVAALIGTLALAGGAVAGWMAGIRDVWITLAMFGFALALICIGLFRSQRIYRLVGTPQLTVEPTTVAPGSKGALAVSVNHREGAPVERVEVTLEVVECFKRQGSSTHYKERALWSRTQSLRETGAGAWAGSVEIPEPGSFPYTYRGTKPAQLRWVVRSQLRGERIPDRAAQRTVWLDAIHEGQRGDERPRYVS